MKTLVIRELTVDEQTLVTGGFNPIGDILEGIGKAIGEAGIAELKDWWNRKEPDGSGIPKNVAKDILDNQRSPSPVPGEESDV